MLIGIISFLAALVQIFIGTQQNLTLARFGYITRGVIFAVLGWIFIQGQIAGVDGALKMINNLRYGDLLLVIIALGLMSFGVYSVLTGLAIKTDNKNKPEAAK